MKRKTTPICECGIKCQEVQEGVFECPRCQTIIPPKGPEDIGQLDEEYKPIEAPKGPITIWGQKTVVRESMPRSMPSETACEQCGSTITDKCGSVCPSCGFINPCKTER